MQPAKDRGSSSRHLRSTSHQAPGHEPPGDGGPDAAREIVVALRSASEQELTIADRLAGKARQAFVLGVGVFVVAQTVAFGNFDANKISTREQHRLIGLAVVAVVVLIASAIATIKADATYTSGDLQLDKLEKDLNAAYEGDRDVIGRLGEYYLGVVQTRRDANKERRRWYAVARYSVLLSLLATAIELVFALVARAT